MSRCTLGGSTPVDGWTVSRRGRVTAFLGADLMKFGPLLGELLADAVSNDALPADLTLA